MQAKHNPHASNTQDPKSKGTFERAVGGFLDAVKRHPKLRLAFVVAYEIAQNFNRNHFKRTGQLVAWPSVRTIGEEIDMSKSAVERHTKKLEEFGLLAIERGHGVSSQYRALTSVPPGVDTDVDHAADGVPVSETGVPVSEVGVPPSWNKPSDLPSDRPAECAQGGAGGKGQNGHAGSKSDNGYTSKDGSVHFSASEIAQLESVCNATDLKREIHRLVNTAMIAATNRGNRKKAISKFIIDSRAPAPKLSDEGAEQRNRDADFDALVREEQEAADAEKTQA
jgi:hypothetical protein